MRHFFGYDADGMIVSIHGYSSSGGVHGWPDGLDLSDPNCADVGTRNLHTRLKEKNPKLVGFICFNCSCPRTNGECRCASDQYGKMKLKLPKAGDRDVAPLWVEKPKANFCIDGTLVIETKLDRAPGSVMSVRLVGMGIPDGAEVSLYDSKEVSVLQSSPVVVKFKSGESDEFKLVAPAQGLRGVIRAPTQAIQGCELWIRGWGA